MESYGKLCEKVGDNLYLITKDKSILDFDTYLQILEAPKLDFRKIEPKDYGFVNIEGAIEYFSPLIVRSEMNML